MQLAGEDSQVHLAVGSRFEDIELVQIVIAESLTRLRLDDGESEDIALAVREAVANAIEHGNRRHPEKRVEVEVRLDGIDIEIRVTDQGRGFDPAQVRDPCAAENLLRPGGRGILFMRQFMDDIDYTFLDEGGTVVTLRKRLLSCSSEPTKEDTVE